jgi:hypothetical protein
LIFTGGREAGEEKNYFRIPRFGPFSFERRRFRAFRFGFLMMNVPLPMYSAL